MKRLLVHLDIAAAIIGLLAGLVMTWLLQKQYIELGIVLAAACTVYLVIRGKLPQLFSPLFKLQIGRRTYLALNCIFFTLYFYSISVVLAHAESYVRPIQYFIAISLMVALLACEIQTLPKDKFHTYFTLFKIGLIGVSLQWVPQAMFPSLTGIDVFGHSSAVSEMLSKGYLPPEYSYAKLPVMPLTVGVVSALTGLSYKFAGMLSVGAIYLAIFIFIFFVGTQLFDSRIGLFSALLVVVCDWVIGNGLWAIPNTMGIALVILVLWMIFRRDRSQAFTFTIFITMVMLIMTHALASFFLAVSLALIWVTTKLYYRLYGEKTSIIEWYVVVIFAIVMWSYWIYVVGPVEYLRRTIYLIFGTEAVAPSQWAVQYMSPVSRSEVILNRAGLLLFFFFSIIGILVLLSRRIIHSRKLAWISVSLAASIVALLGNPLGFTRFLPQRFLAYSEISLCITAALGITLFTNIFRRGWFKVVSLVLILMIMSFLLITNPTSDRESPVYSIDTTTRLSFTLSEVTAADTISQFYKGNIRLGLPYDSLFPNTTSGNLMENYISKDFTGVEGMIIIREYAYSRIITIGYMSLTLDYDPRVLLDNQGFSRVYDCGSVSAFLP